MKRFEKTNSVQLPIIIPLYTNIIQIYICTVPEHVWNVPQFGQNPNHVQFNSANVDTSPVLPFERAGHLSCLLLKTLVL